MFLDRRPPISNELESLRQEKLTADPSELKGLSKSYRHDKRLHYSLENLNWERQQRRRWDCHIPY